MGSRRILREIKAADALPVVAIPEFMRISRATSYRTYAIWPL